MTEPTDTQPDDDRDALLSRLRVIEDQPLNTRAEAFGQLYDELKVILEGTDPAPHAG